MPIHIFSMILHSWESTDPAFEGISTATGAGLISLLQRFSLDYFLGSYLHAISGEHICRLAGRCAATLSPAVQALVDWTGIPSTVDSIHALRLANINHTPSSRHKEMIFGGYTTRLVRPQ